MFACTSMNGVAQAIAVTDVCKTPTPGGPVPMPYPNIAMLNMANPSTTVKNVVVLGMPACNVKTETTLSNGDEAGVNMGVVSNKIMGPCTFKTSSQKVKFGGKPAVHVTCQTGHNGKSNPNAMGSVMVPSQGLVDVS